MAASTRHAGRILSERLREVRRDARLTGAGLAAAVGAGWGQPKVSKIESGRQLPTADDVRAWAAAAGADADELLALPSRAQHERVSFRNAFDRSGGPGPLQDEIGQADEAATSISAYQASIVPGLVQTADYARQMLNLPGGPVDNGASPDDIDTLVAARMRRQAILYEPGRTITIIMSEAALHHRVADDATMREQREHVAKLATTTRAAVGIVPFTRPMPVMVLHGLDHEPSAVSGWLRRVVWLRGRWRRGLRR